MVWKNAPVFKKVGGRKKISLPEVEKLFAAKWMNEEGQELPAYPLDQLTVHLKNGTALGVNFTTDHWDFTKVNDQSSCRMKIRHLAEQNGIPLSTVAVYFIDGQPWIFRKQPDD